MPKHDGVLMACFKAGKLIEEMVRGAGIGDDAAYQSAYANSFGGDPSDYKIVRVTDNVTIARALNNDEHTTSEDGTVDFAAENAKRFICATSDVAEIDGDGVTEATVILQACVTNPDDGTRGADDNSFTGDHIIAIGSPRGTLRTRVMFVAGKATIKIRKRIDGDIGQWRIPGSFKTSTVKSDNTSLVIVEVLQDMG